jgi:hypothetical protein
LSRKISVQYDVGVGDAGVVLVRYSIAYSGLQLPRLTLFSTHIDGVSFVFLPETLKPHVICQRDTESVLCTFLVLVGGGHVQPHLFTFFQLN